MAKHTVTGSSRSENRSRVEGIVTWLLSVVLAVGFLGAGGSKLAAAPFQVQLFQMLGFPGWFMYFTGILETVGAIALLVPRYALTGAVIIICVMLGALVSLLMHAKMSMVPATVVMLVLAAAVGYLRSGRAAGW